MFSTKLCVMLKHFNSCIMQKNAAILTTICILLCFALNYTFPLHRESLKFTTGIGYANYSHHWDDFLHGGSIVERTKKMTNDIEDAIKRIRNSVQDIGVSHKKETKRDDTMNKLSEEDLRQYEQLVIMKKYPYLDLKELDLKKYSPLSLKNTRQSFGIEADANLRADSNLWESDEGLNVEIINRGLSGFSIPQKLTKGVAMVERKSYNLQNIDMPENSVTLSKKSSKRETLGGLKNEIMKYEYGKI